MAHSSSIRKLASCLKSNALLSLTRPRTHYAASQQSISPRWLSGHAAEQPLSSINTITGSGGGLQLALSESQGHRSKMEDRHICAPTTKYPNLGFFAVLDGHGGSSAAELTQQHLLSKCLSNLEESNTQDTEALRDALYQGILDMDKELLELDPKFSTGDNISGTTCACCFITNSHFVIANIGDSFAAVSRARVGEPVVTEPHFPDSFGEWERIDDADGFVEYGRVSGILGVSRALGDFRFKNAKDLPPEEQAVTAAADILVVPREPSDFIVLGTDGIVDVLSPDECTHLVMSYKRKGDSLGAISEKIVKECQLSEDNLTFAVIMGTET